LFRNKLIVSIPTGFNCKEFWVTQDFNKKKCLTEGNDRIRDAADNNCTLVLNRIQDTVAPLPVTVTIGLYGYDANNGMWGYVAIGELAPEVSSRQLVAGIRSTQFSKRDVSAVQFRQWDPRSYEYYSVHGNCNVCSCKSP
jgi:hypothetical protein